MPAVATSQGPCCETKLLWQNLDMLQPLRTRQGLAADWSAKQIEFFSGRSYQQFVRTLCWHLLGGGESDTCARTFSSLTRKLEACCLRSHQAFTKWTPWHSPDSDCEGYMLTQILGGTLADRVGGKWILQPRPESARTESEDK